jgi:sigma-B regulation protein RsbU (phosphoserine phosphatase)
MQGVAEAIGAGESYLEQTTPAGVVRSPMRSGMVIGRSPEVDVVIDSPGASRRHAEVVCDGARWLLRDLGSRNGTLVNGVLSQQVELHHGDVVTIADVTIRCHLPDSSPFVAPPPTADTMSVNTLGDMGSPKVDTRQLFALQRFGRSLIEVPDADVRLRMLCELMVSDTMRGRHAAAIRLADGGGEPQVLCGPIAAAGCGPFHLSQTVLSAVRNRGEPVLATNAERRGDALELSIATPRDPMSVVACPIHSTPGSHDLLYVIVPASHGTAEWLALAALAAEQHEQAERAWESRRLAADAAALERDLARARQVQQGLLPRGLEAPGLLDVAMYFQPCRGVGGDYLDAIAMEDGRMLLAVADVCGKGMQAALVTASLHTFVHAAAATDEPLPLWMTRLNAYLRRTLQPGSFVTMVAAAVWPESGELEYVSAGHPPAIVATTGDPPRLLDGIDNLPLGVDDTPLTGRTARIERGECLALYTDGLTELITSDGRWLGHDGLAQRLAELHRDMPHAGSQALADALVQSLAAIASSAAADDDQTFLLAQRR